MIEKLKKRDKVIWRSFWNGPAGMFGPISKAWNVTRWPTVYVIDHKGVIRHKYLKGKALDDAVDALMAEAEKDRKGKTRSARVSPL